MRGKCLTVAVILMMAVAFAAVWAGEARAAGGIALPRLFNPPPPRAQVADAQVWDPYVLPETSVGPPDRAANVRPRDFLYPPPEATRVRVWYGAPGTFPRPQPQLHSWAPVDYPNIRKRFISSRRTAPAGVPVEQGPALETPPEGDDSKTNDAEAVPARPVKQSVLRAPRPPGGTNAPDF
ncbi:MAG TPA: hypothetical protein VHD36_19710 [Pirellulales bacterium]|nr:hypothetical protein [Pirellulales bacterium]